MFEELDGAEEDGATLVVPVEVLSRAMLVSRRTSTAASKCNMTVPTVSSVNELFGD